MTVGVGLGAAFNQDEPKQNLNTHPKNVKTPDGLKHEKKKLNLERVKDAKVGETVSYNATTGTIVRKSGSYVTIYNEGSNAYDQVHAGETHLSTDTIASGIMPQLWDQMRQEQRAASLNKAGVQEPLHFISRKWSELPMNLKDVLKLSPSSVSVGSHYQGTTPPGGKRDASAGSKRQTAQQERRAFSPDKGFGGEGSSRTFTPGGKKYEKKPNKGPESKRKPAGEGAGEAASAAAARSTGEKPVVTFATGLDKASTYGDLATVLFRLRNDINKLAPLKSPRAATERPNETRGFQSETEDLIDRETMTQNKPVSERSGAKAPATIKSDVEHGAYGGVVTDTPIEATEDYEECRPKVVGTEFDHNHQQKTPKDTKKEGAAVSTGAATTGTPGTFNAKYDPDEDGYKEKARETEIAHKYNTRSGPRQLTKAESDAFLDKE